MPRTGMVSPGGLVEGRTVVVEVPATIANLGAGFDCLGLAVDLPLRVEVTAERLTAGTTGAARASSGARPAVRLEVEGEGEGEISAGSGNRFIGALEAGLAERSLPVSPGLGWRVAMSNPIPVGRGLGSSGAATIAGLLAAAAFAGVAPEAVDDSALLATATDLEGGHSDNVAPALLGGLVASFVGEGGVTAYRFAAPSSLRVVLFIPDRRLATSTMRSILPDTVPRRDAVANLGRATVAMAGLAAGDWTALRLLGGDRLHEPYRAAAYPEMAALIAAALDAGALWACLAGSGSTIAAFTLDADAEAEAISGALSRCATGVGLGGRSTLVGVRNEGARLLRPA